MAATHVHRLGLGAGRYVTAAGVGHRIEADKVDEGYMALRAFRNGVETVRYEQAAADIAIDTRDEPPIGGGDGRPAGRNLDRRHPARGPDPPGRRPGRARRPRGAGV